MRGQDQYVKLQAHVQAEQLHQLTYGHLPFCFPLGFFIVVPDTSRACPSSSSSLLLLSSLLSSLELCSSRLSLSISTSDSIVSRDLAAATATGLGFAIVKVI
jgi:hypothetical protein